MAQRKSSWVLGSLVVGWSLGCGGASLGEDRPGDEGILDHATTPTTETELQQGDDRCTWNGDLEVGVGVERAYVLVYEAEVDCSALTEATPIRKTIWSWAPGEPAARPTIDVTDHEDVRINFTADGLLVMGQVPAEGATTSDGHERMYRVDEATLEVLAERDSDTWYWGTRTSASRRWVAVADNGDDAHPIHVLDPRTLEAAVVATDAVWLEAMWMNTTDRLVGLLMDEDLHTRLRLWSFQDRDGLPSLGGRASMPPEDAEIDLPGLVPNLFMSYSWIGVHPQDLQIAVPMFDEVIGDEVLVLVDPSTHAVRTVPDVSGPVAYTPDGSSVVGYRGDHLVVVDSVTGDTRTLRTEAEVPTFFVSRDGADVLVTETFDADAPFVLFDLETGASTVLPLPGGALQDFTFRDGHEDLWYVQHDALSRVDLGLAEAEVVTTPFVPHHLNWMPTADLLVLDDAVRPELHLFDPDTRVVVATSSLVDDGRRSALPLKLSWR